MEKWKSYWLKMRVFYIDGNNNWSTVQELDDQKLNGGVYDEKGVWLGSNNHDYSWVFPFVLSGKSCKIVIQYQYFKDDVAYPDFEAYYSINPKHGLGVIDDLPADWDSTKFTSIKPTEYTIHDVIPVESSKVVKSLIVWGNDSTTPWTKPKWLDEIDEELTDADKTNKGFTTDLTKAKKAYSDKPYMFCQLSFTYYLEDYPYCKFHSPEFLSPVIENTYFSIPISERYTE